jgi:N-acetylglutamate synthase-like GNAT family acetyltransferase
LIEMIPAASHLLIENIAVRPDQQGKGLGERLLRQADMLAISLGFGEVQLYTNGAFASNLSFFYARRGYQEFQRVIVPPGSVAAGSVAVHMRKRLNVAASR